VLNAALQPESPFWYAHLDSDEVAKEVATKMMLPKVRCLGRLRATVRGHWEGASPSPAVCVVARSLLRPLQSATRADAGLSGLCWWSAVCMGCLLRMGASMLMHTEP